MQHPAPQRGTADSGSGRRSLRRAALAQLEPLIDIRGAFARGFDGHEHYDVLGLAEAALHETFEGMGLVGVGGRQRDHVVAAVADVAVVMHDDRDAAEDIAEWVVRWLTSRRHSRGQGGATNGGPCQGFEPSRASPWQRGCRQHQARHARRCEIGGRQRNESAHRPAVQHHTVEVEVRQQRSCEGRVSPWSGSPAVRGAGVPGQRARGIRCDDGTHSTKLGDQVDPPCRTRDHRWYQHVCRASSSMGAVASPAT